LFKAGIRIPELGSFLASRWYTSSMALVYITGLASSGKSTICEELKRRGFEAHDADKEGINRWCNRTTGKFIKRWMVNKNQDRTKEWSKKYSWNTSRKKVEKLAIKAKNKLIFLCGISANEETVWDLFTKVICLVINETTLRNRITTRTSNNYGKAPHELRNLLEWHKTYPGDYLKKGALVVDANRPLNMVVEEISKLTSE